MDVAPNAQGHLSGASMQISQASCSILMKFFMDMWIDLKSDAADESCHQVLDQYRDFFGPSASKNPLGLAGTRIWYISKTVFCAGVNN